MGSICAIARSLPLWAGLAAVLVGGCRSQDGAVPRLPQVQSERIGTASFQASFETLSTLEAAAEVNLAAQAGGRIQRLLVRQGDTVRPGQLLLVLDQAQLRAEVASLRAQMQTNQLNYQRYQELARQGAASALQRDEFRQAYIAAREALVAREADLAFKDLRAPIAGTVADLRVKQGDVIQPAAVLTRLISNDRLLARIDVPAAYADRVRLGQRGAAARSRPLRAAGPGAGELGGSRRERPNPDPAGKSRLCQSRGQYAQRPAQSYTPGAGPA